ncbi:hypothetical protein MOQ_003648 [Trypanosoma cruzi marinkellei]|uniref:Uncharacterized protein n=1 Tax=Trypanosoma cruzi marinkellei TaxID=85056 RepID=K2MZM1_TRYCR|nr:hypothetical protein MOQ_003648 [Trypanosoma cruzi marinkellei]
MQLRSPDPYFYDNEIDRMLAEMRAQRQQQKRINKERKGCTDNRRKKRGFMPEDLFSSLLERQKSMKAIQQRARPLPKTSFLAESEGKKSPSRNDFIAHTTPKLQEEWDVTKRDATADVSNDDSSVELLRRELLIARRENALLRRDMYTTLTTIGRYLAQFAGKNNVRRKPDVDSGEAENTAGLSDNDSPTLPLPPATSVWELCERGALRLGPEEAALMRSLNEVIASSMKRYVDLEKQFAQQGPIGLQPEIRDSGVMKQQHTSSEKRKADM